MSNYKQRSTLYKIVIIILIVLITLQYFFGAISNFVNAKFLSDGLRPLMARENVLNVTVSTSVTTNRETTYCPDEPPDLIGKLNVIQSPIPSLIDLEKNFTWLNMGGQWKPVDCIAKNKIAIIIPFKNRDEHLLLFLQHMHPFLKRQLLDYRIFVVEQTGIDLFNKATMMNVGFVEAMKLFNYDCLIFHDVDLLPENDRNFYTCSEQPKHMSVAVNTFSYRLPYSFMFGGVTEFTPEHFKLINGYSNLFWGWGGEDDDISKRITYHKLNITRDPTSIARYTMIKHKKATKHPQRHNRVKDGQKHFNTSGLNNLKYDLLLRKDYLLYTWLLVSLNNTET